MDSMSHILPNIVGHSAIQILSDSLSNNRSESSLVDAPLTYQS